MTDTQNKFFSRDRQKAFDEIKEMMYDRMEACKKKADVTYGYSAWSEIDDEIEFIRSVIDMMERS